MSEEKKVLYKIEGKEREQLEALKLTMLTQQSSYLSIVRFIGEREGVKNAVFVQDTLSFVEAQEEGN